jgi:hypothetical protein
MPRAQRGREGRERRRSERLRCDKRDGEGETLEVAGYIRVSIPVALSPLHTCVVFNMQLCCSILHDEDPTFNQRQHLALAHVTAAS